MFVKITLFSNILIYSKTRMIIKCDFIIHPQNTIYILFAYMTVYNLEIKPLKSVYHEEPNILKANAGLKFYNWRFLKIGKISWNGLHNTKNYPVHIRN